MSYISSVEFRAIALACDSAHRDLRGVHIIDNGDGLAISTDVGNIKVVRYAGGCPFTFEAYVLKRLEETPIPLGGNFGKHHHGTPAFDVMADAWLEGLLTDRPVRTARERELGVIYG